MAECNALIMDSLTQLGRYIFGLAMAAFGFQHFIYVTAKQQLAPGPPWVVGGVFWTGVFGGVLVMTGIGIAIGKRAYFPAMVLAAVLLIYDAILYFPDMLIHPRNPFNWTRSSEILAICGVALVLAGTQQEKLSSQLWAKIKDQLFNIGLIFFAASVLVWAVQHFMYARFTSTIVPAWMPWRFFWACFVGAAFLAASLGFAFRLQARLAAILLAFQFFLIVMVVHVARVIASPLSGKEWTSGLIALTMMGSSLVVADACRSQLRVASQSRRTQPIGAT